MREYTYVIDEDGLIWQGGEQYDAPEIYEQFYRNMTRGDDGRLFTMCFGEKCWIVPKDTPFIVDGVRISKNERGDALGVTVILNGGIEEPLATDTLTVGEGNVLYTTVKDGEFPARFSRKAYYELARYVQKDGDGYSLLLGGKKHPIGNSDAGEDE